MEKGLVSIITPCYNGSKFIRETIDSVIAQTYPNWEMIIVDDGSKDNSADIVREYMQKEPRIKLIQQPNGGSASARNNGIRNAVGQYIALLDADDLWLPQFLEKQITLLKEKNAICVCSSYSRIDEESKEILRPTIAKPVITRRDMLVMDYVGCLTGLYDISRHGKVYLHEELKSLRDDYAFWYEISCFEGVIYGNQEILAKYRVLSNSVTGKKFKLIKVQYRFYRNFLKLNPVKSVFNVIRWGWAGVRKFWI